MKKFEDIVIATDLDGTFFGNESKLIDKNLSAIKYFTDNGGHFTIVTGRMLYNVLKPFPNAADYVNMPIIVCDGACIYDLKASETIKQTPIPFELTRQVVDFLHKEFPQVGIRVGVMGYAFVSSPDELKNPYINDDWLKCPNRSPKLLTLVDNWRDLDVIKIVLRVYPHIFHEVYRAIKNKFDGLLSPTYSCDNVIDIQMNGVNKGNALREMTESHFKRDVKLIACGDYVNDIEMLDRADLSVCPENAHSEVKKICDLKLCKNTDGLIGDLVSHIEKILDRGISL